MAGSRFDRPELDNYAVERSITLVEKCKELEKTISMQLPEGRERACALTKLEECEHWLQKGVIAEQNGRKAAKALA